MPNPELLTGIRPILHLLTVDEIVVTAARCKLTHCIDKGIHDVVQSLALQLSWTAKAENRQAQKRLIWEQLLPSSEANLLVDVPEQFSECTLCRSTLERCFRGQVIGKYEEERILLDLAQLAVHDKGRSFFAHRCLAVRFLSLAEGYLRTAQTVSPAHRNHTQDDLVARGLVAAVHACPSITSHIVSFGIPELLACALGTAAAELTALQQAGGAAVSIDAIRRACADMVAPARVLLGICEHEGVQAWFASGSGLLAVFRALYQLCHLAPVTNSQRGKRCERDALLDLLQILVVLAGSSIVREALTAIASDSTVRSQPDADLPSILADLLRLPFDSELCAPVMSIIVALAPVFAVEPAHRYVNSRVLEELYRGATSPDTAESRLFAATVQQLQRAGWEQAPQFEAQVRASVGRCVRAIVNAPRELSEDAIARVGAAARMLAGLPLLITSERGKRALQHDQLSPDLQRLLAKLQQTRQQQGDDTGVVLEICRHSIIRSS